MAYRQCPESRSMRETKEMTGRILPSPGKSGDLEFSSNFSYIYSNKLPGFLFSIRKMREASVTFQLSESGSDQWPEFLNPGDKT